MDYSYLNQAAASFDASSCSLAAAGMDPSGLGNMPCSYGDLTSCSQMSQAAYRYTAAAASMARGYNPAAAAAAAAAASAAPTHMTHHHGGPPPPSAQCAVMGSRTHQEHVHHRAPMFTSTMNLQGKLTQNKSEQNYNDPVSQKKSLLFALSSFNMRLSNSAIFMF